MYTTTDIEYQNIQYDLDRTKSFIRVNIFRGDAPQKTMGGPTGNTFRQLGVIVIQIFVPSDNGTKDANDIASELCTIFRNKQFDGVTCYSPGINDIGDVEGWYQINVNCDFHYDFIE
jgi:hypothetical protein